MDKAYDSERRAPQLLVGQQRFRYAASADHHHHKQRWGFSFALPLDCDDDGAGDPRVFGGMDRSPYEVATGYKVIGASQRRDTQGTLAA